MTVGVKAEIPPLRSLQRRAGGMTHRKMEETLKKAGLSAEEAQVYMSLIESGAQSATQLGLGTNVARTYVYAVTKSLIAKNLAKESKRGRLTVFEATSPDHLLSLIEAKKLEVTAAERELEGVLGVLKSKFSSVEAKPVVTYFEGVEGIKKVYKDTLSVGQPILALVETSKVHPEIYEWVTKEYAPRRIQARISVKAIVTSGPSTEAYTELNEREFRETRLVDSSQFPFEHEINIYGDKLAIINHNKESKLIGIIIENKATSDTFKSWFGLTWDGLKS
jgi:sugar-specific transcriptional regulator TrmB